MSLSKVDSSHPLMVNTPTSNTGVPMQSDKRQLIVEADSCAGQYRIRKFGNAASASTISLDHWRSAWISQSLANTVTPNTTDEANAPPNVNAKHSKRAVRDGVARFSAWVKRSGKGLVVRLRKQRTQNLPPEYTDIHLAYPNKTPELADSQINELKGSLPSEDDQTRTELSGFSRVANELPGTETSSELPTLHGFSELAGEITDSRETTSVSQHPSYSGSSAYIGHRSPQQALSFGQPSNLGEDTLSTSLSLADTAVASMDEDESPASSGTLNTGSSKSLARGLTISGSISYRCDQHTEFEPASPVEVIRKIGMIGRACRRKPLPQASQSKGVETSKTVLEADATEIKTAEPRLKVVEEPVEYLAIGGEENTNTVSGNEQIRCQSEMLPVLSTLLQESCAVTSSTTIYQQAMHVVKDITSTHSAGAEVVGTLQPDTIQVLDSLFRTLRTQKHELGRESDLIRQEIDRQPTLLIDGSGSPAQSGIRDLIAKTSDHPLVARLKRTQDATYRTSSDANREDSRDISNSPGSNNAHPFPNACSPVSPLTVQEQLRHRHSVDLQYPPVTPLTPTKVQSDGRQVQSPGGSNLDVPSESVAANGSIDCTSEEDNKLLEEPASFEDLLCSRPVVRLGEDPCPKIEQGSQATCLRREQGGGDVEVCADAPHPNGVETKYFADYVDHQQSPAPVDSSVRFPLDLLDQKIPARYKSTRFKSPTLQLDTTVTSNTRSPSDSAHHDSSGQIAASEEQAQCTGVAEPRSRGLLLESTTMLLAGFADVALKCTMWLQRHSGQELPVPEGHVRVRWTCSCGEHLFDDFVELRRGAASELEGILNHQKTQPNSLPRTGSYGSQSSLPMYTPGSSGHPSSSATSRSSDSSAMGLPSGHPGKGPYVQHGNWSYAESQFFPRQPQYLLTCLNEARNTPRLANIPLHQKPVLEDKDLAIALRDHYNLVNRKWYRMFRLRGLTSIEFVQFYAHRNRFADIRKCPDVPPTAVSHEYDFDASDLLPPVGGKYLLHLFKHPHEYDDEKIAFLSIPKKRLEKLHYGIGWGVSLTEGFLPERIWLFVLFSLVLFGCVFAVVWAVKEHDIQGAFGVASFFTTLAGMTLGFAQASLG